MSDSLSALVELLEVRGVLSGGLALHGSWVCRTDPVDDLLKIFAVVRGQTRLSTDGLARPLQLRAGDVAVLNGRAWLELRGGADGAVTHVTAAPLGLPPRADLQSPDTTDIIVGGRIAVSAVGSGLLARGLPAVAHLHADNCATAPLRRQLRLLIDEAELERSGSDFAIRQHAQLLVLEILRACLNAKDLPPGSLRLLADQRLQPAITLMHDSPQHRWTLAELARASAMSRTTFAELFRRQAGVPPLTYLTRWRMILARRALRNTDISIGTLAGELGYTSETAFTTAFARDVGVTPLRYRRRLPARGPEVGRVAGNSPISYQ